MVHKYITNSFSLRPHRRISTHLLSVYIQLYYPFKSTSNKTTLIVKLFPRTNDPRNHKNKLSRHIYQAKMILTNSVYSPTWNNRKIKLDAWLDDTESKQSQLLMHRNRSLHQIPMLRLRTTTKSTLCNNFFPRPYNQPK